jgi:membrane protease subunit (stomatin/prohibitin family)
MIGFDFLGKLMQSAVSLGDPTHDSQSHGHGNRQTQAEAIAQYVRPETEGRPKFCGHCGSLIEEREIRQWHVINEHPGLAPNDMRFCLFCGDEFEGSKLRLDHYDTHRPKDRA